MAICNFMHVIKAYLTNNPDFKVLVVLDNAPNNALNNYN